MLQAGPLAGAQPAKFKPFAALCTSGGGGGNGGRHGGDRGRPAAGRAADGAGLRHPYAMAAQAALDGAAAAAAAGAAFSAKQHEAMAAWRTAFARSFGRGSEGDARRQPAGGGGEGGEGGGGWGGRDGGGGGGEEARPPTVAPAGARGGSRDGSRFGALAPDPPFAGAGRTTRDAAAAAAAAAGPREAVRGVALVVDEAAPTTTLQIRLEDGSRTVVTANHTHTVLQLLQHVATFGAPGRAFTLSTTFPRRRLAEMEQTLVEAAVLNETLLQTL